MNKIRIAFFDSKKYDIESFDRLKDEYGYEIKYFNSRLTEDNAVLTKGFDAVCVFVNDVISKTVQDILIENGIRLIALRCAGYNNVDMTSAYERIHVVRVPSYSPHAVAEHAAALMLTLNRKIHRAYSRTRESNFNIAGLEGFDLYGKTAGVIGAGRIGRAMISILKGFGMNVLVYDYHRDPEYAEKAGIKYSEMDEIYEAADIITLHCPLTPETRHLINSDTIFRMKDGVMLINTSRGHLINTESLIAGLKSGKIGSAGLDVYEEEANYFFEDFSGSLVTDDILARLLTFNNVIITSHQAFLTKEALANIASTTLDNINEFFAQGPLVNEICYRCGKECIKEEGRRCFELTK